nr:unnamed protein product [Spirometra erinaceieuropaei]
MNQGSISSALLCLVLARQAVCLSAHALPAVCNYTYPYITRASGPLNITVLTAKEPNEICITQRNESYVIENDMCVDKLGVKLSFPCPYVCVTLCTGKQRRLVGPEEAETELSWNFVISTPNQAFNFTCLSHNEVKCTGVTEVPEPEKCEIENTETGMRYAVRTSIDVDDFAAYVCYIGEEASAQSVYKLGSHDSNGVTAQLIEAKIAIRLNGEQVALNELGTHYLWLQNIQIEDVKCEKYDNKFTCHLSPNNLKIYWMVANDNLHSIIDVLSVNETLRFTGSFGSCIPRGFSIDIYGDERDIRYFHVLHYQQDRLDTMAMLWDFLLAAFSYECFTFRDFKI